MKPKEGACEMYGKWTIEGVISSNTYWISNNRERRSLWKYLPYFPFPTPEEQNGVYLSNFGHLCLDNPFFRTGVFSKISELEGAQWSFSKKAVVG